MMKRLLVFMLAASALQSCVTKGKYEAVVSSIQSKEKQQKKLEKQLIELRQTNAKLRDSAERLGG